MFKPLRFTLGIVLLSASLVACTSPEEKAANYLENAGTLFAEGKLAKAEIEYRNALQINQNLPDAWFGLARIHERKQDWRKTYAVLSKIHELAPGHVDGRIMLGQFLLATNQIDKALNDAKEILEMVPDDARSHSLMAAVHFRLENLKGAQAEVDKALAIDPGNSEALLVRARVLITEKKYDQAFQALDKAIETDPDNVSMYLMKIQAYQEMGDKKSVVGVFLELVEHFPDNLAFKTALARQYINAKEFDNAERVLEQMVEAAPANVDEKLRLVGFKIRHRSSEDAIALLQTYIDYDKKEYRYRFSLGEVYEMNGQFDQAASIYRGIIADDELQANGLEARNKIALIELRAGNRDKAATFVSEVLAQDKNNENSLLLQASLELADQKYDEAVVSMRTVLRDNPDSIKALGLLGQAYEAMGSAELAVESYTRAFQLDPGIPNIANQLAKSLVRQRKLSQADELLQESISRGNRSVETIKLMAQVKISLGEWDKAEQLAKRLQQIEGQEALSQHVLGIVYQGKQEQEASIEAFKREHELAPASAQPIVALVRNYVRNGKVADAKRFLNAVISVHTDNTTAHLLLGQLSLYENDSAGAIGHFDRVIEINPKLDAGYQGLMSTYMRDNELEKAEMIGIQGLSAMPGRPILVMNLASIYEKQRNFSKAIETYESLLEKNPDLIVAKNNLASLLTDYGGDQASLDKARSIAKDLRDSPIPQFRDTYAWVTVKSGARFEEAVAILKGIVKENDEVDVYSYHLGEAYRKKGDSENAIAYLNKALELARPDSDIAQKAKHSLQQLNQ
jgi:tetratricopeptide (TPR) repeat protein